MKEELQRTSLYQYVPFVFLTTVLLVGLPLFLAYTLSGPSLDFPFLLTTVICTTVSCGARKSRCQAVAATPRSPRCRLQRPHPVGIPSPHEAPATQARHVERLALISSDQQSLSAEEHTRILKQLARALESGDPYTHGHSDRVTRHAYMVARAMKLPKDSCNKIRLAAALHDVGKLHTPRSILTGTGRLSDEEFAIIKRHPGDGADMVADLQDEELTSMVRITTSVSTAPATLSDSPATRFQSERASSPWRIPSMRSRREGHIVQLAATAMQLRYFATRRVSSSTHKVVKAFIAYYTGKRGIRLWMSFTSGAPSLVDFSVAGVRQLATNAAVVATSVSVVAAGAVLPHRESPNKTTTPVSQSQQGTNLNNSVSTLTPLSTGPGAMANSRGVGSAGTKASGQRAGRPGSNKPDSRPSHPPQGGTDRPGDGKPDSSDPGAGDDRNDGNDGADENTENEKDRRRSRSRQSQRMTTTEMIVMTTMTVTPVTAMTTMTTMKVTPVTAVATMTTMKVTPVTAVATMTTMTVTPVTAVATMTTEPAPR